MQLEVSHAFYDVEQDRLVYVEREDVSTRRKNNLQRTKAVRVYVCLITHIVVCCAALRLVVVRHDRAWQDAAEAALRQ